MSVVNSEANNDERPWWPELDEEWNPRLPDVWRLISRWSREGVYWVNEAERIGLYDSGDILAGDAFCQTDEIEKTFANFRVRKAPGYSAILHFRFPIIGDSAYVWRPDGWWQFVETDRSDWLTRVELYLRGVVARCVG